MPRYFFHFADADDFPDAEGTVLDDVARARSEAIMTMGEMLKDHSAHHGSGEWRKTVVDEAGETVCQLRFAAD